MSCSPRLVAFGCSWHFSAGGLDADNTFLLLAPGSLRDEFQTPEPDPSFLSIMCPVLQSHLTSDGPPDHACVQAVRSAFVLWGLEAPPPESVHMEITLGLPDTPISPLRPGVRHFL